MTSIKLQLEGRRVQGGVINYLGIILSNCLIGGCHDNFIKLLFYFRKR